MSDIPKAPGTPILFKDVANRSVYCRVLVDSDGNLDIVNKANLAMHNSVGVFTLDKASLDRLTRDSGKVISSQNYAYNDLSGRMEPLSKSEADFHRQL